MFKRRPLQRRVGVEMPGKDRHRTALRRPWFGQFAGGFFCRTIF
jgi:hypothetical protein